MSFLGGGKKSSFKFRKPFHARFILHTNFGQKERTVDSMWRRVDGENKRLKKYVPGGIY